MLHGVCRRQRGQLLHPSPAQRWPRLRNDRLAIGIRAHSGWAAVAVVSGTFRAPLVLDRRRFILVPDESDEFTQPYHLAASLAHVAARKLIERAEREAERLALRELRTLAAAVAPQELGACSVLASKARVPDDLEAILASHALIHAAEGNLFRDAVARAAQRAGLEVQRPVEHELAGLLDKLENLKPGPPWSKDEKLASLAALLALEKNLVTA